MHEGRNLMSGLKPWKMERKYLEFSLTPEKHSINLQCSGTVTVDLPPKKPH